MEIKSEIQNAITSDQAWHYRIIPQDSDTGRMSFFHDKTSVNEGLKDELAMLYGGNVELTPIDPERITALLNRYYKKTYAGNQTILVDSSKVDRFLDELILEAKDLGSSDIHIEIYDEISRVRIRIDGILIEKYKLEKGDYPKLVNRIKIMSHLDIAEKRLPQDGRIEFKEGSTQFDIRVSVLPTLHGEKIVLRLLNRDSTKIDIQTLGMNEEERKRYLLGIKKPHGIILISGPTGSGKTTTLYATLKLLNDNKRNILTVEDPIEYTLEGVNQVQMKESIGLTFASALKSFLRQDPDVIMLGEIRDQETAEMAVRAALTGHLVLSTIHTNSAWGTVSRLIDMKVPAFLLANTLNTTAAQRLLRKLCVHCKEEKSLDKTEFPPGFDLNEKIDKQFVAVGCDKCYHTGYKGRVAIYEIIPVDLQISKSIKDQKDEIKEILNEKGIQSLVDNALKLFKSGETSLEEVYPILMGS